MNWNSIIFYVSKVGVVLTALVASFVVYKFAVNMLGKGKQKAKEAIHSYDMEQQSSGQLSSKQTFLSKYGVMYRLNNYNILPSQWTMLKVAVGMVLTLIVLAVTYNLAAFLMFPIGYVLTETLFKLLNKRDNEDMTMDIYNTYANMKIQLSSGVYIADCLEYTFKIAQNKRYKEALKELILNFSDKTMTSSDAIRVFKDRFECKEIDKLCSMMTSFVEYGISEAYMQDIMYEVEALLEADALKSQQQIESKTGFMTFLFFVLVVAMVAIGMFTSFDGVEMFLQ